MNCSPGDLALIVGSSIQNDPDIGKIVRVVEAIPSEGEPCWGIECSVPLLVSYGPGEFGYARDATIADRHLRPIRGWCTDGFADHRRGLQVESVAHP